MFILLMFYHSMYGILIFHIVLFGQGFAINEINPSYYLICFFYIYIYIYGSIFFNDGIIILNFIPLSFYSITEANNVR